MHHAHASRGSEPAVAGARNRVLLVDDDPAVLRVYSKALASHGWEVHEAGDGADAIQLLRGTSYDVIVSDVSMPQMGGLDFLRRVREHDLDVPVILMTGGAGLESAISAVEYGAFRYLLKPVDLKVLEGAVGMAVRLHVMAKLKREALEIVGIERRRLGDRAGLEARFHMALRLLWMAYQPIVSLKERRVFGYEALVRSSEPTLSGAGEILDVAERLGRMHELGRAIRRRVAENAASLPADAKIFVNLHALELNDEELFDADTPFARLAPRTVLEITERASLDGVSGVAARVRILRGLGFQIAVDDLGAGYAGLTSYSLLEPEIAKIDMSLVRRIDEAPRKQSIVRSMKGLCDEQGTLVVAEGVETAAERDTLASLGYDLLQGYLFGRATKSIAPVAL